MNLKSVTNTEPNTHELILEIDANKFEDAIEAVYKRKSQKYQFLVLEKVKQQEND